MSERGFAGGPLEDALLAACLFLTSPRVLGGLRLRGGGPARDAVLDFMRETGANLRRLPSHIDDERLLGGVDIAASLAAGRQIQQFGLLAEAKDSVIVVPMAERMPYALAGRLAQASEVATDQKPLGLVLLDDGMTAEEAPPEPLLERVAFHCNLSQAISANPTALPATDAAIPFHAIASLDHTALEALAATATALGVHSLRPLLFAQEAARANAALHGRKAASDADLTAAVRLVLVPHATQLPQVENEAHEPTPPAENNTADQEPADNADPGERALEDMLVEAAQAAIPADLLAQLSGGKAKRQAQGSGAGQRRKSTLRGKPLGTRQGLPRGGARLALIDSLRAAVPWQPLRRREMGRELANQAALGKIIMRKEDLRVKRFEERTGRVTVFCVDASGSAAAARLAEAKGAVELMLAQVYVTRSEVALIAFRGEGAELLLPPTRSLTRARRALAELPGGGGTPLASGLNMTRDLAEMIAARGRTPSLVILTDGRGNIAADGSPGRKQAGEDADAAAKAILHSGVEALVIDIAARPGPHAPELAQKMGARFLALPMADAKMLHAAVAAATASNSQAAA
ncbi:MAG: magnesium chelatase subunit D [Pseudomonadota bacterium]